MRRFLLVCLIAGVGGSAAAASLEAQRRALAALNVQEDALAAQIGANRREMARLLGALELFSRDPPPPLLVSPKDAQDAVRAMILSQAILPELRGRARALSERAQALAKVRRQAAEASGDLFAAESAIEDARGRLDAVTQDAALFAPPDARRAAGAMTAGSPPADLLAPADGALAVGFGGQLANGLKAEGFAYRTGAGAPVRSPTAAVVDYAGPLNGWGQVVILRAAGDCHIVLSGLGKVTVTSGQQVAGGFPLGAMPATGHRAPELYFEVRLAGQPVDPALLMASGSGRAGANVNAAHLRLRREGAD
ncbi:MAG: peptidoglycan DD-metalloendopeptidase family protein [Caulobacteraceae bacterium]|nr:peptidoglycan DD-metalloendopeptidase family protein [Caulobacteraceae bacterium]